MRHAREDYQRIQDPDNIIPEDEPVFLIRGQDITAPVVIAYWAAQAKDAGASQNIITAALSQVDEILAWQAEHGAKIPDL